VGIVNRRLPNPPRGEHPPMVAFYSALSGDTGIEFDKPILQLPDALLQSALQSLGLIAQGYYVFAPGAEYGPAKRWPAGHFSDLAAQLQHPVVLLGSAKESALCAEIAAQANARRRGACLDLCGRTSLDQALAVIASARAMVSNDSGLMHVAAAFGTPQVAVFGSSSPLHTPPLSEKAHVIWLKNDSTYQPPLDCAPCFQRECPLGHTRCLVDITPQQVLAFL
jgi:heptosyltransferase-2